MRVVAVVDSGGGGNGVDDCVAVVVSIVAFVVIDLMFAVLVTLVFVVLMCVRTYLIVIFFIECLFHVRPSDLCSLFQVRHVWVH